MIAAECSEILLPSTTVMAPAILESPDSCGAVAETTDQLDIDTDIPVFEISHSQSEGLAVEGFEQDCEENLLRSEFIRCCEDWGCFRLANHGIAEQLLGRIEILCRNVFKLPKETKEKNASTAPFYGGYLHGGYLKGGPTAPFYESLGIGPGFENIQEFSDLMWPHGNQNFCEVMREFAESMKELSDRIHKFILASLGVSNYYASNFEHCNFLVRMNEYQVSCDDASGTITLPAHTDGSSITVLLEDEVEVKPMPNSCIVFLGDTLQAWSNNRTCSGKHRVIVKGQQSRLSLAFFRLFLDDMEIEAPLELVDNEHPRRYRAFRSPDYAAFKSTNIGKWENPLDAYAAN